MSRPAWEYLQDFDKLDEHEQLSRLRAQRAENDKLVADMWASFNKKEADDDTVHVGAAAQAMAAIRANADMVESGGLIDPLGPDNELTTGFGTAVVPKFIKNTFPDLSETVEHGVVGLGGMLPQVGEQMAKWAYYTNVWPKKKIMDLMGLGDYSPEWLDFFNAVTMQDLSPEQYSKWQEQQAQDWEFYKNHTKSGQSMAGVGGEIVATALPSLWVPLAVGTTLATRVSTGAIINGLVAGATIPAESVGESMFYMGMGAASGGILAGVIHGLGKGASALLGKAVDENGNFRPLTPDEVGEAFDRAGVDAKWDYLDSSSPALGQVTAKLNAELEQYGEHLAKRQADFIAKSMPDLEAGTPWQRINLITNEVNKRADMIRNSRPIWTMSAGEIADRQKTLNVMLADGIDETADFLDFLGNDLHHSELMHRRIARGMMLDDATVAMQNLDELDYIAGEHEKILKVLHRDPPAARKAREIDKGIKQGRLADEADIAQDKVRAFEEAEWNAMRQKMDEMERLGKLMPEVRGVSTALDAVRRAQNESPQAFAAALDKYKSTFAKLQAKRYEVDGYKPSTPPGPDDVVQALDDLETGVPTTTLPEGTRAAAKATLRQEKARARVNKEMGFIHPDLFLRMGTYGVGGLVGSFLNPDDPVAGALFGAATVGGLHAALKFGRMRTQKLMAEAADAQGLTGAAREQFIKNGGHAFDIAAGKYYQESRMAAIAAGGNDGKFLVEGIERARTDAEINIGRKLIRIREALRKAGLAKRGVMGFYTNKDLDGKLRLHMQGEDPMAPRHIRQAANEVKQVLKEVLDEAHNAKMIDDDHYRAMVTDLFGEKGYWPRIFNKNYLATEAGQARWVEKMSTMGFKNEQDAQKLILSIIGEDISKTDYGAAFLRKFVKNGLKKGKNNLWYINPTLAARVLKRMTSREYVGRSTHLGHSRKLHPQHESLLNEFMVDDPLTVMTSYLDDTLRNIEFAKQFGKNDELVQGIFDNLRKNARRNEAEFLEEFYYNNVGDPRAKNIEMAIRMSDQMHTTLGKLGAWSNLHLIFAQMINSIQAGVFGSTYLAKHGGPGFKAVVGGLYDFLKNPIIEVNGVKMSARRFAAETGADLETVMMQQIGEMSAMNHYMFGRKMTDLVHGKMSQNNPIAFAYDTLNDPHKFLHRTGFTSVEKIQRQWAALTGRRIAKSLLEQKAKLANNGVKASDKRMKKLNTTLRELGLPESTTLHNAGEDTYHIAGLGLSNKVNFRNTPDRLPLIANNPYFAPIKRFKTFAYHTQNFLRDEIGGRAGRSYADRGKALLTYLGLGATAGVGVYEGRELIRDMATGRLDRTKKRMKETPLEKVWRGITTVGGFGLMFDMMMRAQAQGSKGAWESVAGPALSDAVNIGVVGGVNTAYSAVKGEASLEPLWNEFVRNAPPPLSTPAAMADYALTGSDPRYKKRRRKKKGFWGSSGRSGTNLWGGM